MSVLQVTIEPVYSICYEIDYLAQEEGCSSYCIEIVVTGGYVFEESILRAYTLDLCSKEPTAYELASGLRSELLEVANVLDIIIVVTVKQIFDESLTVKAVAL